MSHNELDATRSLVGPGESQPKSGDIHKLCEDQNTDTKENVDSMPEKEGVESTQEETGNEVVKSGEKAENTSSENVVSTSSDTVVTTSENVYPDDAKSMAKICAKVEQLIREGSDVDTQSKIDTLRGILKLLTKPETKKKIHIK